jgi:hypothetical protein
MNYSYLKIGIIASLTLTVIAVVIRALWQIIVIPTSGTMVIFIPLIFALLGGNVLVVYLIIRPNLQKLKYLPVVIGITAVATAGIAASVSHFVNFIPSPEAAPLPSKIIGTLVLLSGLVAYLFLLLFIWTFWKNREK